jgi:surface antigen
VRYQNEHLCRCRNESHTAIRGPSSVPECSGTGLRCRNADTGGIGLDADAQLCK